VNLDEIRTLYSYDRWATGRLLQASQQLSPAAFTQDLHTSHRSVRGTLVHTLWSEWIWLQRWQGTSPKQVFAEDRFPDVAALQSRWAEIEHDRQDFVAGLTEDRLAGRISYENLQGQRWEYALRHMMQHVLHHSTFHRGQVVTLLRQLGQTPPATDFLVFVDESGR
jgi:uncharacterized damage-inducible protein DinB